MGLIKSANAPVSLSPFSMSDIEQQARIVLQQARFKSQQMLADASSEAEELKKQAYVVGLAEGRRQGLEEGRLEGLSSGKREALEERRGELTQLVQSLTHALRDLDASRRRLEADVVSEVIALAVSIARRVAKRQGMVDPQVVVNNIAEVVKLAVHAHVVRIAVHPDCRAALQKALPELQLQWPALKHADVAEDPALAPGGCRVYTAGGNIDADLDAQVDRIAQELVPSI